MNAKLTKLIVVVAVLYFDPTSMAQGDLLDGQTLGIQFSTFIPPHMQGIDVRTKMVVGPGTELINFGAPQILGYRFFRHEHLLLQVGGTGSAFSLLAWASGTISARFQASLASLLIPRPPCPTRRMKSGCLMTTLLAFILGEGAFKTSSSP